MRQAAEPFAAQKTGATIAVSTSLFAILAFPIFIEIAFFILIDMIYIKFLCKIISEGFE